MFRYYHLKNLPEFFANFYSSNSEVRQHYTRISMKLHKHYQRTNYLKYSLANTGVEIWDKLDQNLKNIASYFLLKKKLKKHLVYILKAPTYIGKNNVFPGHQLLCYLLNTILETVLFYPNL